MNYTKSVEKWDVFEFSAEGTTAGVPCVRLFRRRCGWMHAGRMSLMLPISIWFLLFLIF